MHLPFDANSIMILAVGALGAWNAYQQMLVKQSISELKVWIFEKFVAKQHVWTEPAE